MVIINKINEKEKELIIKLHLDGLNTVQIGKIVNRNNSVIGRFLKRNGYENNGTNSKLNNEDKNKIKKLYLEGLTSKEIYEKFFFNKIGCQEVIERVVRNFGIARKGGHKNNLLHDYFENINTSNKAYFLGFILMDGNIYKYKNCNKSDVVQIAISLQDKYILEILKNELKCDNKISEYNKGRRHECRFGVCSNKMSEDLKKHGVVPNKSLILDKLPLIDKEFIPDLIRGIFDANGSVHIRNNKYKKLIITFYSTNKMLKSIMNQLINDIDIGIHKITDQKNTNVSLFSLSRSEDIINFYNYIYHSDNIICLNRKRNKFIEYLK